MLLKLSKIKNGVVYRNPVIFFETPNKNKDNLIIIPSSSEETMLSVINSELLRKENVKSIYTPFKISPMDRKRVIIPLKEYYANIFEKTNNKIQFGRKTLNAYMNRNLIYDINVEWSHTLGMATKLRGENPKVYDYIQQYLFNTIKKAVSSVGYSNTILIVPFDGKVKNFNTIARRRSMLGDVENITDPATIFTRLMFNYDKGMRNGVFKGINFIVFYNINANAFIKLELDKVDPDVIRTSFANRIVKLYSFGGKLREFEPDEIDETEVESEDIPTFENTSKEDIVEIVAETSFEKTVNSFYKKNKIKNMDVAPRDDGQDIVYNNLIDKIKSKLNDNKSTTPIDSATDLSEDEEIKKELTRYAALKKQEGKINLKNKENTEAEMELLYNEYQKLPKIDFDKQDEIEEIVDERAKQDPRLRELASTPIASLSKEYIDKQFYDDILKVASSLSSNSILPFTLYDLQFEDNSDPNNQLMKLKLRYRVNINGTNKSISIAVNIPKILDNHFMLINGNRWTVDNQLAFLPVTKTAPDSVKITTNYSILFIDREKGYISRTMSQVLKLIDQEKNNSKIKVKFGDSLLSYSQNNINNIEYSEIAKEVYSIEKANEYALFFNYDDLAEELKLQGVPEKYWKHPTRLIPIGFKKVNGEDKVLFLFNNKVYTTDFKEDTLVKNSLAELIYEDIYGVNHTELADPGSRMSFSKIKIAGGHYPLILILSMIYGMKNTIDRYKIKYHISKERENKKGFIEIKFKDVYLYYEDTIPNQLLLNGLSFSHPEKYKLEDYNTSLPFDDWIGSVKKISTSTKTHFKNTMRVTLNILLDPITQEILEHLGIPNSMLDLLLYTNSMLADNNFRPIGNVLNYRLRNYEQIAGILNHVLMKAYIDYLNGYLRGNTRNTFDVGENDVIMALTKASSVNPYSALSPVLELETYSRTSQKGFMGLENSASYSKEMREFDDNKLSVYSAGATSFGGNVGITRALTYKPHIKGIRGYINEIEDINTTSDASMLSASELLSPFLSRHADASRQAMTIGQFKHNMPLNKGSVRLWSTGAEQVIPGLLSSDFIFKAEKDGKVNNIDNDKELVELLYVDNSKDYIDISTTFIRNSASAFYTPNKLIMKLKQGDSFKKGDVIAYNDVFFREKKDGRVELLVGTLSKVAIAPIDNSFEDGTIITKKLSKKGTSRVVIPEIVTLTPTSSIKTFKKIGDYVDETTSIIDYDDFGDNSIDSFLTQSLMDKYSDIYEILPSSSRFPNYHGVIKDIEVFYNVDKEELNDSLVKLIEEHSGKFQKKLDFVGKDNVYKIKQKAIEQQRPGSKEDGVNYTGVLIKFYIQSNVPMGIGDKLSFDSALKGVISNVLDDKQAPYSEYRPDEEIESILTPTGRRTALTYLFQ